MNVQKLKSIVKVKLRQVRDGRVKFAVDKVSRPAEVFRAVQGYYKGADREILSVLCLDSQNSPSCFHIVSIGGLNTTRTRPADILKAAILSNSLGLILVHNHPSGVLDPSPEDIEFTHAVQKACELVGVEFHDHLIVSDGGFTSMRERGLL